MKHLALVITMVGCGAPHAPVPPPAAPATIAPAPDPRRDLRGERYCEILIASRSGTHVAIDVYNTIAVSDCPADAWAKANADQIRDELGATKVIKNGPRYWTIVHMTSSKLIDPTPRLLGGIAMRLAGRLARSIADAREGVPYQVQEVQRTTVWVYDAGKPVYELVDPQGHVYDMQSFSGQKVDQTIESLATLGQRLHVPDGWTFRSRVLTSELQLTAVGGVAHVVQDDLANTYTRDDAR